MKYGNENDLVVMHQILCIVMRLHQINKGVMVDVIPGHGLDIDADHNDFRQMMMIGYPGQRVSGMVLARALLKRYDNISDDIETDLRVVAENILETGITFTPETIRLDITVREVKDHPGDYSLTISCPDDCCLYHRDDCFGDKETAVLFANNYIRFLEKYGMTVNTNWNFRTLEES
jgi:hypothetical protein